MIIGIDVDGTITTPFYWLDFFNEKLGTSLTESDVRHYDHHLDFGLSLLEFQSLRERHLKEIHLLARPRPQAKETVNRLFFENDLSHIITARERSLASLTQFWLKKEDFLYNGLYTLGSTRKTALAQSLDIDLFFEDRLETALEMIQAGIPTILFDTPYNQSPAIPGIHRVSTWGQAYRVYRALKGQREGASDHRLKDKLHRAI